MLESISQCEFTPEEEIRRRIEKLKEQMEKRGIYLSVILHNVHIFYLAGTVQKSVLLIPLEDEAVLLVEKNADRARMESPLAQITFKGERELRTYVRKYLVRNGKCGMELDIVPFSLYDRWRRMLDGCEIEDISKVLREIRAIKSEFEISQIKKSGQIASLVFSEARKILKEGEREVDIAAKLECIGRMNGHQGFIRMRGLNQEMMNIYVLHGISATIPSFGDVPISGYGTTHAIAQGPSLNRIKRGVPTLIDYGGGYNGYVTDETRLFIIGEWEREILKKAFDCSYQIVNEVYSFAKEGTAAIEIFERALTLAKEAGLEDYFMGYGQAKVSFVGHGFGLEINELPVITGRHRGELKEGMVFAFEPKFVIPGVGASGLEVDYIVRKWGLERVTDFPLEVVQL